MKQARRPWLTPVTLDSGGRDQEDCSSKAALGKYLARPYLKKTITKKGLVEWLKV
jgi:hypothetical protein